MFRAVRCRLLLPGLLPRARCRNGAYLLGKLGFSMLTRLAVLCIMLTMLLRVIRDTYRGHARTPWLVVVPSRVSATGRRQYRRFPTRAAAAAFCAEVRRLVRERGEQPIAVLPAPLAEDAAQAAELLRGTGLSLTQAVRQLLRKDECPRPGAAPGAQAGEAPLTLRRVYDIISEAKRHQSPATHFTRRSILNILFSATPALPEMPLVQCTPSFISAALDAAWPHSPASWNSGRRQLHACFQYAIKRRLVRMENPVTPLDFKRVTEGEITALPPEGLRRLLAACRPPSAAELAQPGRRRSLPQSDATALLPYIAICAFAGIRPTECSKLTWQDVDLEDGVISVRAANSKTGGTRHVELHPTLRAWLLRVMPAGRSGPIVPQNYGALARLVRRRAGFGPGGAQPWQPDCLRHSYATYYLKARCGSISQLQVNMGHTGTVLLYTRYMNMRGVTRASAEAWWQVLPD